MAKKTKAELGEDLNRSIIEAKAQYDNVVKPTQEAYRAAERKVREILETSIKPLCAATPMIATPMMYDTREQYENDYERAQYQKVIDAAEDAYRKIVKNAMSDYYKIEKPAKAEKDAAIRLANKQYDEALKELRKVDDWFVFRGTYQKAYWRPSTHEEIKMKAPECSVDIASTDPQSTVKCHFCGNNEVRTEAGINRVKYRLKYPGAGFWNRLLGSDWKYACHDCTNYMIHLRGTIKVRVIDESVPIDITVFCRTGLHQMCGGFECKCDCHKHVMLYDTKPFVLAGSVCPSCQGSGRIPWVLPYLSAQCTTCNGLGRVI